MKTHIIRAKHGAARGWRGSTGMQGSPHAWFYSKNWPKKPTKKSENSTHMILHTTITRILSKICILEGYIRRSACSLLELEA